MSSVAYVSVRVTGNRSKHLPNNGASERRELLEHAKGPRFEGPEMLAGRGEWADQELFTLGEQRVDVFVNNRQTDSLPRT